MMAAATVETSVPTPESPLTGLILLGPGGNLLLYEINLHIKVIALPVLVFNLVEQEWCNFSLISQYDYSSSLREIRMCTIHRRTIYNTMLR
jgi:hypothetical protein